MSAPPPTPARPSRRALLWCVGFATFAVLMLACVSRNLPPLPRELTLDVTFPVGLPGRMEPLVSAGIAGEADFLGITYLDATSATFFYDYWGFGGPVSERITFSPGSRHSLRITLPAFTALRGNPQTPVALLRLEFDGREILKQDVPYHPRAPNQIFFGENPVGGSTEDQSFRGRLATTGNLPVFGTPDAFFSWRSRVTAWFLLKPGEVLVVALLSLAAAFFSRWLLNEITGRWFPAGSPALPVGHSRAPHVYFFVTLAVCATAFAYVVTGGSFRFYFPEVFGNFYDYQAASLLHGRLDVPEVALGSEAFVYAGKHYGYFGPTPALLRLPFVTFDLGFGQLSRSFLLAYYLASLAAVYALLTQASRLLTGRPTWPARTDVVLLIASTGLGTTLFFVSSRAYIYHEAILCGVAFALWSSAFALRWLAAPASRWWLGALVCGTLAVHARPPVGLFALSLLGCVAAAHLLRPPLSLLRSPVSALRSPASLRLLAIGLLSVLGVLSFNGLSYLKFKSFDGAPLKYHVQYHAARLAAIEGKNFHVANFRHNFDGYLWRPHVVFKPTFPYLFASGPGPDEYRDAKIDLAEPTLALPYAMPAVFFMAVVGGLYAAVRWPGSRLPLSVLAVATLPMATALFMAIAISQRYTADFCPALLIAAAFGLVSAELLPRRLHRLARLGVAILAVIALFITAAITLHYQGEGVWGVPKDVTDHYQTLRKTVDTFLGFKRP